MFYRFKKTAGFTLIEMIVVIAIFGIVTTIILANLPTFRDRSSLDLVAQEVAINIRGAQVYGASGRVQNVSGRPTYQINFTPNSATSFSLYRLDSDGKLALQESYNLTGGFEIAAFCLSSVQDTVCSQTNGAIGLRFTRPHLEPEFYDDTTLDEAAVEADIIIHSLRNPSETRLVRVWKNGQISVETPTTNPTQ